MNSARVGILYDGNNWVIVMISIFAASADVNF